MVRRLRLRSNDATRVLMVFALDVFERRTVWVTASLDGEEIRLTGQGRVLPLWSTEERAREALTYVQDGADYRPKEVALDDLPNNLSALVPNGEVGVNLTGTRWRGLNVEQHALLETLELFFEQIPDEESRNAVRLALERSSTN